MRRPYPGTPILGVVMAASFLLLSPPSPSRAAGAAAETTRVVVFHPWGVRGQPLRGHCWTSSSAAWRPDAWRCLAGNQILDPCFSASPHVSSVICQVLPPFTGRGLRLRLTQPLPLGERGRWPRLPHAWVIQLEQGVTCAYFTSMPPPMANPHATPPSYGCSDGTYLMEPRPGRLWTATRVWLRDTQRGFVIRRARATPLPMVWE
ncbi:MAG: hypothetical protein JOZ41_07305 [Chloroflexi bacterium]|nr:hypothetical protein [Chloroflexota bacterium]